MNVAYVCVAAGASENGNGSARGVAAAAGAPVADGDGSDGGVAPSVGAGAGVAGDRVDATCGAATGPVLCAPASDAVPTSTARKATDRRRIIAAHSSSGRPLPANVARLVRAASTSAHLPSA